MQMHMIAESAGTVAEVGERFKGDSWVQIVELQGETAASPF